MIDKARSMNQCEEKFASCNVAIIGGGFSGSMLAAELLRRYNTNCSVVLIESGQVPGRGIAYGTQFEGHLLNVRAKNMSAYAEVPDHFVKWAQRHYSSSVKPDDFLPRTVYGQYVSSQLREAIGLGRGVFRCIRGEAVALARVGDSSEIRLATGQTLLAHKVVLALGNFPPADLQIPGKTPTCSRYIPNPWSPHALTLMAEAESVLLIGSGLTSVDVTLELRARGFEGKIHLISRRGLLPQSHNAIPFSPFRIDNAPRTIRGLLRMIRAQAKAAEARGSNWREVIDSLRPVTQQIWRTLPPEERRRFLRHLRSYWEVHRHRIAARIADQLTLQLRSGQIQMHTGRVTDYREVAGGIKITYRQRKTGDLAKLRVDCVVNCTGPECDYRRVGSPLLLSLMKNGLARAEELSLGLDVADDGAVVDAQGCPRDFLYALGPLRKGKLWESVAVPELRVQVAALATLLAGQPQDPTTHERDLKTRLVEISR
ncbi:MAG: FAD/NAD(P)-binding protein [Candidatus Sulfotelmatobacter sp.]